MRITTTYGANKNGAGKVTAKGGGKQKTVTYDHDHTPGWNHGAAAAELLVGMVPVERRGIIAATAKVTGDLDNGRMTLEVSL